MSFEALVWAKRQRTGHPTSKAILLVLAEVANEDHWSWPKKKTMAQVAECSRDTVRRHLRRLEELGFIRAEERYRDSDGGQTSNWYRLNVDGLAASAPPPAYLEHGGVRGPSGGVRKDAHGGGAPVSPQEPSREPLEEPPEKEDGLDDPVDVLWSVYVEVTGRVRYRLTDTRRARLRTIWDELADEFPGEDVVPVWAAMVRALWSSTWRREAQNRHDPVNVFRTEEQRETWKIAAVESLDRGFDGSDHTRHARGAAQRTAAAEEERELREAQARSRAKSQERREREAQAHHDAAAAHERKLREWYAGLDEVNRKRIDHKVAAEIRRTGVTSDRAAEGIFLAELQSASGIRLDAPHGLTRPAV